MAYDLDYFFDRSDRSADQLLAALMQGLRDSDVDAALVDVGRGADWPEALDWVAATLTSGGHDTGIHVEIHADGESVNQTWQGVADSPGASPRPEVLGVCTLTLSGDVDWNVFEWLRTFLRDQWSAAEHDETDGFAKG